MKPVWIAALSCLLLAPAPRATPPPGTSKDPTDASTRYQKNSVGNKPEDWARNLNNEDPQLRLQAVKLLGDSPDPKSTSYLMSAVASPDIRVSTAAVDYLGRSAAPEAAALLAEQLVYPGASPLFRQHVLVALGKIADPATGPSVLHFLKTVTDPGLRGAAIHALGEIGSDATRGELQELTAQEADPRLKGLMQDAVARIAQRSVQPEPTRKDGTAIFTHSEGKPASPDSER